MYGIFWQIEALLSLENALLPSMVFLDFESPLSQKSRQDIFELVSIFLKEI